MDQQEIADEISRVITDITADDTGTENAIKTLRELRDKLDVVGDENDTTIGISLELWSYEYTDEIRFITAEHTSIVDAVEELVSHEVPRLVTPGVDEQPNAVITSRIKQTQHAVDEAVYDRVELDEEVFIHCDLYYCRASIYYDGVESGNCDRPTATDITDAVNTVLKTVDDSFENECQCSSVPAESTKSENHELTDFEE